MTRALAILGLLLVIVEQYLVPTIANSLMPVRQLNWAYIAERVLKLSLPTLYGWVFLFYVLFHLWLNVLAEITLFGDREFYKVGAFPLALPAWLPDALDKLCHEACHLHF